MGIGPFIPPPLIRKGVVWGEGEIWSQTPGIDFCVTIFTLKGSLFLLRALCLKPPWGESYRALINTKHSLQGPLIKKGPIALAIEP